MWFGIDIGGTRVKIAWRTETAPRPCFATLSTSLVRDPDGWFDRLVAALPRGARAALESSRLRGIGVGVAGQVRASGMVVQSPNLPAWRRVPVAQTLARAVGVPVVVDNDANMAALGLVADPRGMQAGLDNVFVVTLGSGVGGAWLLGGRLYRQRDGGECEIGHAPVVPDGRRCACGRYGCVEAYAGGNSILAIYNARAQVPATDVAAIGERAHDGDAWARAVFAAAGAHLGRACAWIGNILGTRSFVFVGGVAHARPWLLGELRAAFRAHAFTAEVRKARFRFPPTRDTLGAVGALYAAAHPQSVYIDLPTA